MIFTQLGTHPQGSLCKFVIRYLSSLPRLSIHIIDHVQFAPRPPFLFVFLLLTHFSLRIFFFSASFLLLPLHAIFHSFQMYCPLSKCQNNGCHFGSAALYKIGIHFYNRIEGSIYCLILGRFLDLCKMCTDALHNF